MKLRNFFTRNKQNDFWYKIWKLDDTYSLQIDIYDPPISREKYKAFLVNEHRELDEYLSILNNPSATSQITYNSLLDFIGLSDEDILDNEKIVISLIETINRQDLVLNKITLFRGKIQEYAVLENGKKYTVKRNGDWSFLSNTTFIKYIADLKNTSYSVIGEEKECANAIKEKISTLQRFVK